MRAVGRRIGLLAARLLVPGCLIVAVGAGETGRLNEFLQAFAADRKKTAAALSEALLPGARQDTVEAVAPAIPAC